MFLSKRDRRLRLQPRQRVRAVTQRRKILILKKRRLECARRQNQSSDELSATEVLEDETANEPADLPSHKKKRNQRPLKINKRSQTKKKASNNKQSNIDGIMNGHDAEDKHVAEDEHVFEDAAISASEEENDDLETAETETHDKMLAAISLLDKKKSSKQSRRTEAAGEVSELNLRPSDGKTIELGDLLSSLERTAEHGELKKKLLRMQKTKDPLDVPLPKPQADRAQRTAAYRETATDISKWQPIVKKNREAEHLFFPLKQHSFTPARPSTSTLQLKPVSALERDIMALMSGPGALHNISDNKRALSESEEKALKAMDLEKALERRHELQKARALQSFYEQKARRQNKIKSKKYRRLKKKAKERNAEKLIAEGMSNVDPEEAQSELEKAEALRAKERMTLRHHNKSKWATKVLQRAHKDPVVRQALTEQKQLGRQLKQKIKVPTDDGDDDNSTSSEDAYFESDEGETQPVVLNSESQTNPWLAGESLATVKEGKKRKRKQRETETLENFKAKKIPAYHADDGQLVLLNDGEEGHTKENDSEDETEEMNANVDKESNSEEESISDEHESNQDAHDVKFGGDMDDRLEEESTSSLQQETLSHNNLPTKVVPFANLDPSNVISVIEEVDEDDKRDNAGGLHRQQSHIAEAFANDDVIAEFIKDKEQEVEEDTPKDVDLTLPGWGSWAGHGTILQQKPQKQIIKKAPPTEPREDRALPHVIIRQKRDKKFGKHQISHLPFPFTSREQFEKVLCAPIGRHWNTEVTFQSTIKPQVKTQMGAIIQPIEMTDDIKKMAKTSGIQRASNGREQQRHNRTEATAAT